MLPNKDTTILSEINDFFTTSEKAITSIYSVLQSMHVSEKLFLKNDACNVKYRSVDKLTLLLLFTFFDIKDASHFSGSALYKLIACGKDVFYRMLNDSSIDWRTLAYKLNKRLMNATALKSDQTQNKEPRCLIVDDTDLHKTGRHIELIGRIYNHVSNVSLPPSPSCLYKLTALSLSQKSKDGKKVKNEVPVRVQPDSRRLAQ